jgi:hypothetical protein
MRRYEIKEVEKYDAILFASERDVISTIDPYKVILASQGVMDIENPLDSLDSIKLNRTSILFIGKLSFLPNRIAIIWFCENILPNLNNKIILKIVGQCPPLLKTKLLRYPGVEVLGYVDNVVEISKTCFCGVAPISIASGMQTKVLDYLNFCIPVVCTEQVSMAFEWPIKAGLHVFNDSDDWAKIINHLFEVDFNLMRGIEIRQLLLATYGWESIVNNVSANIRYLSKRRCKQ